jgi:hypothetical protein
MPCPRSAPRLVFAIVTATWLLAARRALEALALWPLTPDATIGLGEIAAWIAAAVIVTPLIAVSMWAARRSLPTS